MVIYSTNYACIILGVSECSDGGVLCGICGVMLHDRAAQLHHYSTDYHAHNQDRVLRGLQALTLGEYEGGEWGVSRELQALKLDGWVRGVAGASCMHLSWESTRGVSAKMGWVCVEVKCHSYRVLDKSFPPHKYLPYSPLNENNHKNWVLACVLLGLILCHLALCFNPLKLIR